MVIFKPHELSQAIDFLKKGKTIVFPTETSYGLGCDATNQKAVDKIFKIKGRARGKSLLVVVPTAAMAKRYLKWNEVLDKLAKKYWPGPLTIVGVATPPLPQRRGQGEEVAESRSFSFEKVLGSVKTLQYRREMRKNPTRAEKILWSYLRNKKLGGLKFYRQHGIGPFIVDFYYPVSKLIIEIDGDVHFTEEANIQKDKARQKWLEEKGYKVFRYNNVDIFNNLNWILEEIYHEAAASPPPAPSAAAASPPPAPSAAAEGGWQLAQGVISSDNTVAIRVTSHPLLKRITEQLGRPLIATSANISEAGEIYDSKKIIRTFSGRKNQPDILIDAGKLPRRRPTTIVSVVSNKLEVLRQGDVKIPNSKSQIPNKFQ